MSPDSTRDPAELSSAPSAPSPEPRVWHYVLDDSAFGPTTTSDLRQMALRGLIEPASLVWREEWPAWRPVSEVEELRTVIAGLISAPDIAENTTAQPQRSILTQPADGRSTARLCLLRLAAAVIDQCILLVPTCVTLAPVMIVLFARGMTPDKLSQLTFTDPEYWIVVMTVWVTQWAYAAITESSVLMGTIGKRACGLRVTDLAGRRLGFGRASARYWAKLASTPLLVGYVFAAFTGGHRALHDLIAKTLVRKARE